METNEIDITGMDKAEVLCRLYNNSKPQGLGFLQATAGPMSIDQARKRLKDGSYFDYLAGRVMKVDLSGDVLDPSLYDRDNGAGAARRALAGISKALVV